MIVRKRFDPCLPILGNSLMIDGSVVEGLEKVV